MVETDYKSLSIDELVKQISPSSPVIEELTKRGVIRNRNYTGNIGEYFAIDFFNNVNEGKNCNELGCKIDDQKN